MHNEYIVKLVAQCIVIPAMVQRLRFSINMQHLSHKFGFDNSQAVPAVKTPMGAVAKNT